MFWSPWSVLPFLKNNLSYTQPTFVFALQEDYDIVHVCFDGFFCRLLLLFLFQKDFDTFHEPFSYLDNFWCFFRLLTATLIIPQLFNPFFLLTYTNSNIFLDAMLCLLNLCKSLLYMICNVCIYYPK